MKKSYVKKCSECFREIKECDSCKLLMLPKWLSYPKYKPRPNQFVLVALGGNENLRIIPLYYRDKKGFVYETACAYDSFEEENNITHFMYVSEINPPLTKKKTNGTDDE